MVRKKSIRCLLLAALLLVCLLAAGCNGRKFVRSIELCGTDTVSVTVGNFRYEDYRITVRYTDGTSREIPLSEEMISGAEQTKFYRPGNHEVTIAYLGKTATFDLKVAPAELGEYFDLPDEMSFVYDGKMHTVPIPNDLPDFITVSYPNGYGYSEVNEDGYDFVVRVSAQGYETKDITVTVKIVPAEYVIEETGRVFPDNETFVYDGTEKRVEVENLPPELTVKYTYYKVVDGVETKDNHPTSAGDYVVYADYTCLEAKNYVNPTFRERRTFTIEKAKYDMKGVRMEPDTVTYNGEGHMITLPKTVVLPDPEHLTVSYTVSRIGENGERSFVIEAVDAGEYIVTANFIGSDENYETIEPLEAKLTICKAEIDTSGVLLPDDRVTFDNEKHYLACVGNCPEGVEITYENNDGKRIAGSYLVTARLTPTDGNHTVTVSELTAWLVIEKRKDTVPFTEENLVYDGNGWYELVDTDPIYEITVHFFTYDDNMDPVTELESGTLYYFVAEITYRDDDVMNASCDIPSVTGAFMAD